MVRFTKMQGAGNDYIYINGIIESIKDYSEAARLLSDRHYGIGSDGLVLILSSECADFRMRMFNSDGSESEMCGNASRCVAKYVYEKGLTNKTEVSLETGAGVKFLKLHVEEGEVKRVTVDMGEPVFECADIPVIFSERRMIAQPIFIDDKGWEVTCISMGNPHAVVFTDEIDSLDLTHTGPLFEHFSIFPKRINSEFIQIIDKENLKMRVWERGAGETLACGTGACAAAVASCLNGFTNRKVRVRLRGGDLDISWDQQTNHVFMTGDAKITFEGFTNLI